MRWGIASLLLAAASLISLQAIAESCMPALPGFTAAPASIGAPHTCLQDYPPTAIAANEEGKVLLGFFIRPDGTTRAPRVLQSSGFADLDRAAVECSRHFVYRPAKKNGKPVEVPWQIMVQFKMDGWGTQPVTAMPARKPPPPPKARKQPGNAKPNRHCTPLALRSTPLFQTNVITPSTPDLIRWRSG
jgi:TonB family protein